MHYEKRAIVLSPRGLSLHVILSQMVNNQSWNFRSQNNSHFRKCRSESQERKLFFSYIKYYLSRYMWFTVRSLEQFRLLSPCFFSRRDQSPTSNRMSISIQRVVITINIPCRRQIPRLPLLSPRPQEHRWSQQEHRQQKQKQKQKPRDLPDIP